MLLTLEKTIAKLDVDSNRWTKLGNLQHSRHDFGVIEVGKKFLVIGGEGDQYLEICEWVGIQIECKELKPTFKDFFGPAMITIFPGSIKNC